MVHRQSETKEGRPCRVLIAAAGSGGHLFPAEQLASGLGSSSQILFVGHGLKMNPFFRKEERAFQEILASPLKKGFFLKSLRGMWQSFKVLRKFKPDVVVGFGSFHTFPILLVAVLLRKKIVLFEPNAVLGKVNRAIFPFAKKIGSQFSLPLRGGKVALVPFLPWHRKESLSLTRSSALGYFGLQSDKKTILVFGGSQGAHFLNETVPKAISLLQKKRGDLQVIHLTGKKMDLPYAIPNVVKDFESRMDQAYKVADLAICRSGAGTIGELIHYKVPSLLIPYPFASEDHQKKNGDFFTTHLNGGKMVEESEATPERISELIEHLLENREVYERSLGGLVSKQQKRVEFVEVVKEVART